MLVAVETHERDQFVDPCGHPRVVPAHELGRDRDVLRDRHVREKPGALEHVADAPPERDRVGRPHVLAAHPHRASARVDQAVDQAQQRGLARAGRADNGEEFALAHVERNAVEHRRGGLAIAL